MQETRVWSWVRKIPWRRKWQPTPAFLPGKSHGQRSLADYSPWGCKELGMTEYICTEEERWGATKEEEKVKREWGFFMEPLLMGKYSCCFVPAAYSYFRKKLTTRGRSGTSQAEFYCCLLISSCTSSAQDSDREPALWRAADPNSVKSIPAQPSLFTRCWAGGFTSECWSSRLRVRLGLSRLGVILKTKWDLYIGHGAPKGLIMGCYHSEKLLLLRFTCAAMISQKLVITIFVLLCEVSRMVFCV